ncbi:HPr family phosphocarrier protein [Nocardiopsis sp. NRRL B-16309]|uniref:HPr family phosphocarrier protein n=1 Tax=Nocardiopsis sp. NRRL B-16309 TaxID=1519494 RepID=UPI0006AE7A35|nr:HPr family phosphocarrier protein [Nocardiopsis sp. NRRL B-16309]KOX17008.1 dihydroxyacetone kinase [Nocardiopsis sp. NRRL B-16309]
MPTQRTVTIGSRLGLHARPATLFVKAVNETGLPVYIARPDQDPVDARSMLAVMALGANHGETVTLSCDDAEDGAADRALDELVALLSSDMDNA